MKTILGAGGRVGGDASGVIVRHHDDDARAGDQEVEPQYFEELLIPVVQLGEDVHDAWPPLVSVRRDRSGETSAPPGQRMTSFIIGTSPPRSWPRHDTTGVPASEDCSSAPRTARREHVNSEAVRYESNGDAEANGASTLRVHHRMPCGRSGGRSARKDLAATRSRPGLPQNQAARRGRLVVVFGYHIPFWRRG